MNTLFGTSRTAKSRAQIASSEYAIISVGGKSQLGQNLQGTYMRQIQTIMELGNPGLYWIGGHEQGNLTFQRLVGKGGFFDGWDPDECGILSPCSVDLGSAPCVAAASGGLRFEGSMVEQFNFTMQAGTLEITEGVSLRVASMSRA